MKLSSSLRRISKKENHGVICQTCSLLTTMIISRWLSTIQGFTICNVNFDQSKAITRTTSTTEFFAAKKVSSSNVKSNQRKSNIRGGGFGRIIIPENDGAAVVDIDDDYRIFPPLESRVRDTLIPAALPTQTESDEKLSAEIYQRLDQIYGFPSFNYDNSLTADLPTSPLDYLMKIDQADDLLNDEDLSKEVLTLQDLPLFNKVCVLHTDPMILSIDNFFTIEECDQYVQQSETKSLNNGDVMESRSPTVGKDAAAKAQRTSTTFYHKYENVPELISKASRLLGVSNIDQWEEPQTVRYRRNEKFTWHLDALGPIEQQQAGSAGQRIATVLVYLTDLNDDDGGATLFRDLGTSADTATNKYLRVQPKKGMALLFFPSAGGITDCPFDIRTLHCGEVVSNDACCDKWIAQLWLRQRPYTPTAPPGNRHSDAYPAITNYCRQYSMRNHNKS